MWLELRDIHISFDDKPVLRGVNLELQRGEILVLLGPSGCGKTTLLRTIAGLEEADAGTIRLDGRDLGQVPVHQRGLGMVFQDYALFPHKTVAENVAFGLQMQHWSEPERLKRVAEILNLVGLAGFGSRRVYDLSGGEQQRVALARALAPAPGLLLLDEPLGSLDRALRERLMTDLRAILKEAAGVLGRPDGITAIYVTHDQEEAFAIGDRIAVMHAGLLEQVDRPVALYRSPANAYVARFLGMENVLEGTAAGGGERRIHTVLGDLSLAGPLPDCPGRMQVLVRPGAGAVLTSKEHGDQAINLVRGQVTRVSFRGRHQVIKLAVATPEGALALALEFDSAERLPAVGERLDVSLRPEKIQVLECC